MSGAPRPWSVTILACVYLLVGTVGFIYHFRELAAWEPSGIRTEIAEVVALVCGVFLLRGRNWARWLALAWIAFHTALSVFHTLPELAMHTIFLALIAWILLSRPAAQYFR